MKAIKYIMLLSFLYSISSVAQQSTSGETTASCKLINQIRVGMKLEDAQSILGQENPLKKVEPDEDVVQLVIKFPNVVPPITEYTANLPGTPAPYTVYDIEIYLDANNKIVLEQNGPSCH